MQIITIFIFFLMYNLFRFFFFHLYYYDLKFFNDPYIPILYFFTASIIVLFLNYISFKIFKLNFIFNTKISYFYNGLKLFFITFFNFIISFIVIFTSKYLFLYFLWIIF